MRLLLTIVEMDSEFDADATSLADVMELAPPPPPPPPTPRAPLAPLPASFSEDEAMRGRSAASRRMIVVVVDVVVSGCIKVSTGMNGPVVGSTGGGGIFRLEHLPFSSLEQGAVVGLCTDAVWPIYLVCCGPITYPSPHFLLLYLRRTNQGVRGGHDSFVDHGCVMSIQVHTS